MLKEKVFYPSGMALQELMGRPLRLKFSEKNVEESGNEKEEEQGDDGQLQES